MSNFDPQNSVLSVETVSRNSSGCEMTGLRQHWGRRGTDSRQCKINFTPPDRKSGPPSLLSNEHRGLFHRESRGRNPKLTIYLHFPVNSLTCFCRNRLHFYPFIDHFEQFSRLLIIVIKDKLQSINLAWQLTQKGQ
jgi:hypothetical protein